MLPKNTDNQWELFGQMVPYYGVTTHDEFKKPLLDEALHKKFFLSGERHVSEVLNLARLHLDPEFSPQRSLDFGCGVGRLAIPLAQETKGAVVGVDVSDSMLGEARRNAEVFSVTDVTWVKGDERMSGVSGNFDLIHCFNVLQHIAPDRGEKFLKRTIELLNPGGVGILHYTYIVPRSPWLKFKLALIENVPYFGNLVNLMHGRPFHFPRLMMNRYDLNRLCQMLQEAGCGHLYVRYSKHEEVLGAVLFFQKKSFPDF